MPSDLPYRPCVGIMLFNADGKVFVGDLESAIRSRTGERDGAAIAG